jgi:dihydrolipoamide dehydrogenase
MSVNYDLAIIGGGPAGYHAAERAAKNGLTTVLFEKNAIGGVCLNEGCIPTKTLLYSAKIFDLAKAAPKYGIFSETPPSFDTEKIIARKNKVVRKLTAGINARLSSCGVAAVHGMAVITGEAAGRINISCNDETFSAAALLLCTGSEAIVPPITGLSDVDYLTSREALSLTVLPASLAIIGGGVVGLEFASFFNSLGVRVHVIEMMPEILHGMDSEISAMLRAEYAKKGVAFRVNTRVVEVTEKEVVVERDGVRESIEVERILVSAGRRAVVDGLGLERLNVEWSNNGVKVNEYMQTTHPQVYAAGDVTGRSMLAHTAIREAEVAVDHLLGGNEKMDYSAIPGIVYTNPEVAGAGRTEDELTNTADAFRVLKLPMPYSGRFVAENEQGNGLCKIIVDAGDHIIGCHLLGNPASELIVIAGMAIARRETVDSFSRYVYPHPTVAEIIRETLVHG